jgi:alpha-tubulin suppressor-like RCC1 family protein
LGLVGVVSVAAGNEHSLALKRDGSVVAWGDNTFGQTNVPSGLTEVIRISAAAHSSSVLTRNGKIVAWGKTSMANLTFRAT